MTVCEDCEVAEPTLLDADVAGIEGAECVLGTLGAGTGAVGGEDAASGIDSYFEGDGRDDDML